MTPLTTSKDSIGHRRRCRLHLRNQSWRLKMVELKGHRSMGGVQSSIYNAMPLTGVGKLVAFMKDFQAQHALIVPRAFLR
ncbi:hypothetical protein V6N11_076477 [Hibiscus sabdariffa]|uniref:Uncharacterized protein n=1 Tax=Hibiscus sabdariffa TaxID=183260 RepID=A0ABR2Q6D5_9ROSI